jgi:hypothetical protein
VRASDDQLRAIIASYSPAELAISGAAQEYVTLFRWVLGEATQEELLRMHPDLTPAFKKKRGGVRVVVVQDDGSEREVRL